MGDPILFDAGRRIALILFPEILTESAFCDTLSAAYDFARSNEICGSICDASAVRDIQISPAFLRRFIDSTPVITPGKTRVTVAPSPAAFGLARFFYTRRDPEADNTFVVRTMQEAYEIFGIENADFKPLNCQAAAAASGV